MQALHFLLSGLCSTSSPMEVYLGLGGLGVGWWVKGFEVRVGDFRVVVSLSVAFYPSAVVPTCPKKLHVYPYPKP